MKFYGYDRCGTCRNAKKWLQAQNIAFEDIAITEQPPSAETLQAACDSGEVELKQLFNRSGQLYREMNMKERVKTESPDALIALLAANGKLIKRPFVVSDDGRYSVGFKPDAYEEKWL